MIERRGIIRSCRIAANFLTCIGRSSAHSLSNPLTVRNPQNEHGTYI